MYLQQSQQQRPSGLPPFDDAPAVCLLADMQLLSVSFLQLCSKITHYGDGVMFMERRLLVQS
jgi:hypothetical protein